MGARHPLDVSIGPVTHGNPSREDPDPVSIAMAQSAFHLVDGRSTREVALELIACDCFVSGMRQLSPSLWGHGRELIQRVTQHAGPALVDAVFSSEDIHLPDAYIGAFQGALEPLAFPLQFSFILVR